MVVMIDEGNIKEDNILARKSSHTPVIFSY